MRGACERIAPVWPLERFVAVNPYLGLTDLTFAEASARLAAAGNVRTTMPVEWYVDLVAQGRVTHDDVAAAMTRAGFATADPEEFLTLASAPAPAAPRIPTVAEVAALVDGHDWPRFVVDRVSLWAAVHFDQGQVIWHPGRGAQSCFSAWRADASVDRTPEVAGLRGFRAAVRTLPPDALTAAAHALLALGVDPDDAEPYLHAVLLRVGGWAAHAARLGWEAAQRGEADDTLFELLTVMLCWEALLLQSPALPGLPAAWSNAPTRAARDLVAGARTAQQPALVLQDAWDRAAQRGLVAMTATAPVPAGPPAPGPTMPSVQAVFCIDVRSEVLRRHLEGVMPTTATLGFAGFFGFPVAVQAVGHEHAEPQCPVLLTPAATLPETVGATLATEPPTVDAAADRSLAHHVRRAWKSFKMGAVSCFSFVGPVGLAYLPKLVADGSGRTRPVRRPETEGLAPETAARLRPSVATIPLADRVRMAEGALRGMSLTRDFAPLVVLVGHGSSTVNNPYATGLDCGACGGHSGAHNARVAAMVIDDATVRAELGTRGIVIPDTTRFVAALHDTTTDEVTVFDDRSLDDAHRALLADFVAAAATAGRAARAERAPRLGIDVHALDADAIDAQVIHRSRDWAQVRPEWGLAGCRAFVAAPRSLTAHLDLGGRVFLHSYDHELDPDGSVLELIMTAPMVVASWISLQYFGSTVDNEHHGAGDKTLHNVIGRLGVLEGNGGDLRTGLPLQSVHDGAAPVHEPLRLAVVLAAPTAAIDRVLDAHADVRALVEHEWIFLLAMDDIGRITHRWRTPGNWESL
jgi:uncharacterized protein YbcC (UPF0753/DUF2309 family)